MESSLPTKEHNEE